MKLATLLGRVRTTKEDVDRLLGLLARLDDSAWEELDAAVVTRLCEAQGALAEAERRLTYTVEIVPRIEAVKSRA
jgi:hypothetical protein